MNNIIYFVFFTAKKLPKSDQSLGGGAAGQGRKGVDLNEGQQSSASGCCK